MRQKRSEFDDLVGVKLEPGAMSSLRHWHEVEDEFVYVLAGELTLIDEKRIGSMNTLFCLQRR